MSTEVVYLGPNGTFAHLAAMKRYRSKKPDWRSYESVTEVCRHVAGKTGARGVIPITNSSGGDIYPTVDALLDDTLELNIEEELALKVSLALVGRHDRKVRRVYSHFAPYAHCRDWLERKYPNHEYVEVPSTAVAVRDASEDTQGVALGSRLASKLYGMEVLKYPILSGSDTNVTHFFVVGRQIEPQTQHPMKTSLAVRLINKPGSLHDFLDSFRHANVNLSRIISRPINRQPKEVAFFIDVDGDLKAKDNLWILEKAKEETLTLRVVGTYSCRPEYSS